MLVETVETQGTGLLKAALLTKSHRGHSDGCDIVQHLLANCFIDTELQSSERAAMASLMKCHFLCPAGAIVLKLGCYIIQNCRLRGVAKHINRRHSCFKMQVRPPAQGPRRQLSP